MSYKLYQAGGSILPVITDVAAAPDIQQLQAPPPLQDFSAGVNAQQKLINGMISQNREKRTQETYDSAIESSLLDLQGKFNMVVHNDAQRRTLENVAGKYGIVKEDMDALDLGNQFQVKEFDRKYARATSDPDFIRVQGEVAAANALRTKAQSSLSKEEFNKWAESWKTYQDYSDVNTPFQFNNIAPSSVKGSIKQGQGGLYDLLKNEQKVAVQLRAQEQGLDINDPAVMTQVIREVVGSSPKGTTTKSTVKFTGKGAADKQAFAESVEAMGIDTSGMRGNINAIFNSDTPIEQREIWTKKNVKFEDLDDLAKFNAFLNFTGKQSVGTEELQDPDRRETIENDIFASYGMSAKEKQWNDADKAIAESVRKQLDFLATGERETKTLMDITGDSGGDAELTGPGTEGTSKEELESKGTELLADNQQLEFVRRMSDPGDVEPIKNKDGSISTHKMRAEIGPNGRWYVFPEIIERDGKLVKLSGKQAFDRAVKKGQAIITDDKELALWLAEGGYKTTDFAKSGTKNEGGRSFKTSVTPIISVEDRLAKERDAKRKVRDIELTRFNPPGIQSGGQIGNLQEGGIVDPTINQPQPEPVQELPLEQPRIPETTITAEAPAPGEGEQIFDGQKGDPWEYRKVGDEWFARKKGEGSSWLRATGKAQKTISKYNEQGLLSARTNPKQAGATPEVPPVDNTAVAGTEQPVPELTAEQIAAGQALTQGQPIGPPQPTPEQIAAGQAQGPVQGPPQPTPEQIAAGQAQPIGTPEQIAADQATPPTAQNPLDNATPADLGVQVQPGVQDSAPVPPDVTQPQGPLQDAAFAPTPPTDTPVDSLKVVQDFIIEEEANPGPDERDGGPDGKGSGIYSTLDESGAGGFSIGASQMFEDNAEGFLKEMSEKTGVPYEPGSTRNKKNKEAVLDTIGKMAEKLGGPDGFRNAEIDYLKENVWKEAITSGKKVVRDWGMENSDTTTTGLPNYLELAFIDYGHNSGGGAKQIEKIVGPRVKKAISNGEIDPDTPEGKRAILATVMQERIKYAFKYIDPDKEFGWLNRRNRNAWKKSIDLMEGVSEAQKTEWKAEADKAIDATLAMVKEDRTSDDKKADRSAVNSKLKKWEEDNTLVPLG